MPKVVDGTGQGCNGERAENAASFRVVFARNPVHLRVGSKDLIDILLVDLFSDPSQGKTDTGHGLVAAQGSNRNLRMRLESVIKGLLKGRRKDQPVVLTEFNVSDVCPGIAILVHGPKDNGLKGSGDQA